ncbi:MAG: ATP-grasp domain-containing protein [Planctomycetota bacterium]
MRRIGLLFGMERDFPGALAGEINRRAGGEVTCEPIHIGALRLDQPPPYDLVLDRISHEVPFYRTFLKQCCISGIQVINNPFWFAADDKYFGNLVASRCGVAVPKTILLPHKDHPPNTGGDSYSNLRFPIEWGQVFEYLGFPIFLKPSAGGGWKHVYRCTGPEEFFAAYEKTGDLCMMAQEEIAFTEYFRCYGLGRERVHVMRYDPKAPFHERYVRHGTPVDPDLHARIERDVLALCQALGYDFNTAEFAVREGVPYAIDFTNPCPDAAPQSVGDANFAWVLGNAADFLIERARNPEPFAMTGSWPERVK